ncbi:hypothetical protein CVIRNUC_009293 [Coccomyxa viridis]|uniref:Uncharacterized protein n=1 Tax=Coccomyxa viridis TaxID=1274662 RepID=A0AAV1IJ74_9CHLO|nr:hypothetical protein CVIRNUC_009293 [Coccomyxa viridis]
MAAVVEDPLAPTVEPKDLSGPISNASAVVPQPYVFQSEHEYQSAGAADMVMKTLSVDPELRPQQVTRKLSVQGRSLQIFFSAADAKTLRAAVGTFYDLLGLATRMLEAFAPQEDDR